jgi:hypothetical protein
MYVTQRKIHVPEPHRARAGALVYEPRPLGKTGTFLSVHLDKPLVDSYIVLTLLGVRGTVEVMV